MPAFGALLRQIRTLRVITVKRHNASWQHDRVVRVVLSQNELGRRAGLDPSHVNMLERGRQQPGRGALEKIIAALDADDFEAARLRVAAGYWPFPDCDADTVDLALGILFAIGNGDYRPLLPTVADQVGAE